MGICTSSCKIKKLEQSLEQSFKMINDLKNETDENFNYMRTKICAANMKIKDFELKNKKLEQTINENFYNKACQRPDLQL